MLKQSVTIREFFQAHAPGFDVVCPLASLSFPSLSVPLIWGPSSIQFARAVSYGGEAQSQPSCRPVSQPHASHSGTAAMIVGSCGLASELVSLLGSEQLGRVSLRLQLMHGAQLRDARVCVTTPTNLMQRMCEHSLAFSFFFFCSCSPEMRVSPQASIQSCLPCKCIGPENARLDLQQPNRPIATEMRPYFCTDDSREQGELES